jgi:hypothetical protein
MSISVAISRPFRVVGRSTGKHAMPRGTVVARATESHEKNHQPKHAVSMPRQRAAA